MPRNRKRTNPRKKLNKVRVRHASAVKKVSSGLDAVLNFENAMAKVFGMLSKKVSIAVPKKIGVLFVLFGVVLFLFPLTYKNFQTLRLTRVSIPNPLVKAENRAVKKTNSASDSIKIDNQLLSGSEQSQPPARVVISSLSVDLPIVEANVVDGLWELSETSASHGVGSANPGQLGNVVIFAHARDDLFGPLRNIKQDTIIYILTKDHWYTYKVTDTKLVDPSEVQVVGPTSDETLTLYTCDGFLDSKRLIITAKPQR